MSFRLQPQPVARPNRCQLFGPGSNVKLFEKMAASAADVINLDLEDSVAPSDKEAARANVIEAIGAVDWGKKTLSVRINGLDSEWGEDDLAGIAACRPDAILLPKTGTPGDLTRLEGLMAAHETFADTRIWAMIETPEGVLNAAAIAAPIILAEETT